MFNTLKHASTRQALLAAALFATATSAFAQAPTEAQKSAIRSACRSDFMAHCSSVTPGGVEAYQCLQKNMSSLSSGCQTAVRAVEPAAAPKSEAAPAKSEPAKSEPAKSEPAKTEAAPAAEPAAKPAAAAAPKAAAKQPSNAQVAAVKSACRADYPKVCASVPPGGAPALECLEKNKAKVSAACAKAVTAAAGGGGATATAAPAAAAAPAAGAAPAAAPAVIVLRPLRPREELFIVRSACGADIRTLCAGVPPGGGRIVQCIASKAASLSPGCKDVLAPFAAR
ncbi:chemotaxis protein histidine kinase CheA [Bradyrhizobium sp. GM24.11]